ncbi:MAG: hypothetical protein ABSC06_37635 [Rhodopila sp.]
MSESKEFVPAIFANRFFVKLNPAVTKITFADQTLSGEEILHTGVVLITSDAVELAKLILKIAQENKAANPQLYKEVVPQ